MGDVVTINKLVENKIIEIRNSKVIIDSDVAVLYGVETKHINQAVKNNPDRFPDEFIIELTTQEKAKVVKKFDHLSGLKFSKVNPKAFTEQGLYMLATILKSERATATTIAIVKTFAKVREATRSVVQLLDGEENGQNAEKLGNKISSLMSDILLPDADDYDVDSVKTTAKLKLFGLEISKEVVRKPKKN